MLARLILVLFTIAFLAYTWLHSSNANSKTDNPGLQEKAQVGSHISIPTTTHPRTRI